MGPRATCGRTQGVNTMRVVAMFKATREAEIEIRRIFEAEDSDADLTPELRALEDRLRVHVETTARPPRWSAGRSG